MPKVRQIINPDEKERVCREMLAEMPEITERRSPEEYAADCRMLPMWADIDEDVLRGFTVLKETSPCAAEVLALGVKPEFQRHKIGKSLFTALLNYARRQGYEYIQVKSVKTGVSPVYDSANIFYESLGFRELEILPLWGDSLPCQVYIRNVNY